MMLAQKSLTLLAVSCIGLAGVAQDTDRAGCTYPPVLLASIVANDGTVEVYELHNGSTNQIVLEPNSQVVFRTEVWALCPRSLTVHRAGMLLEHCTSFFCESEYSVPGIYELEGSAYGLTRATVHITHSTPLLLTSACRISLCLEGAYRTAEEGMRADLSATGLLTLSEPYSAMGHYDASSGSEAISSEYVDQCIEDPIVDWVRIELQSINTDETVHALNALLHASGKVRDAAGNSNLEFVTVAGIYRLKVKHRNHLSISTSPIEFPFAIEHIDLRLNAPYIQTAYDTRVNLNGTMAMRGGNAKQDEHEQYISYTGTNNDRDQILTVLQGTGTSNVIYGYFNEDVNMDGSVTYFGENNDRDFIGKIIYNNHFTTIIEE